MDSDDEMVEFIHNIFNCKNASSRDLFLADIERDNKWRRSKERALWIEECERKNNIKILKTK